MAQGPSIDNLPGWLSKTSEMVSGDDITVLIDYFTKDEREESEDSGDK